MGCDIHTHVEVRGSDGAWQQVEGSPWDWRSYGMFGFLADVRNYSAVPVIAEPRYSLPDDVSKSVSDEYEFWGGDAHTPTWLTIEQLQAFDYDAPTEDRRYTKQIGPRFFDGSATAEPGQGEPTTMREFLGEPFFRDLDALALLGEPSDVRVVFWFDN